MDDFEALPLQFMNYHGATNIDEVSILYSSLVVFLYLTVSNTPQLMETIEFAVNKDDIQYIIIDNLQFLMPRIYKPHNTTPTHSTTANSALFDRLELQDYIIDKLRHFATEKNITIFVVIHPRKEEDGVELGLSSIGGTAKATQEADMVFILQVITPFIYEALLISNECTYRDWV
jgi:twinkle protein